MVAEKNSTYGWFIITLASLTNLIGVGIPIMCLPVLFKDISHELDLSLVQVGLVWGAGAIASMITNPFGGLMSDRFGIKRVLSIACMLAGLAGAARGMAPNFPVLLLAVFCVGFFQNTIVLTAHKSTGIWFTGRKVVLANGLVSTGIAVGMMLGAMISDAVMVPLLGGWRHVLIAYGAATFAMGLLWTLTRGEEGQTPLNQGAQNQGNGQMVFFRSISRMLRARTVWGFGVIHFCIIGSIMGMIGYLPLYLRSIGWAPTAADGALAALNAAGMLAAIPLSILSSRSGLRKGILIPMIFVSMVSLAVLPFVNNAMVWFLVILFGLLRDGYFAILMTMIIEAKGIGPAYAGTAMGVIFSIGNFGVFLSAPIGNRLAAANPSYAFIFWAVLMLLSIVAFRFTREKSFMVKRDGPAPSR